jgi:hypothetical protein
MRRFAVDVRLSGWSPHGNPVGLEVGASDRPVLQARALAVPVAEATGPPCSAPALGRRRTAARAERSPSVAYAWTHPIRRTSAGSASYSRAAVTNFPSWIPPIHPTAIR